MTNLNLSKKEENYIKNLLSENQEIVAETIEEIKIEGRSTLLPHLIDLLLSSNDEAVKKQLYNLFCELKQPDSIPVLIDAIKNEKYAPIQDVLIRTCWENGLDYTPYLSILVDIVINGEFMNAFEAFTVIENMEGTIQPELIEEQISIVKAAIPGATVEKEPLMADLIQILPAIK
jgi:hypothetical protein